jgi:hypothetical protein
MHRQRIDGKMRYELKNVHLARKLINTTLTVIREHLILTYILLKLKLWKDSTPSNAAKTTLKMPKTRGKAMWFQVRKMVITKS